MTQKNSAWQRVLNARKTDRPKALDLIPYLFDEFFELSGDRAYGDDKAIVSGLAFFEGIPVTVLAQSKGRNLEENMACHFGMAHPEGYRKAMRLAKQAEKFNRPIVCIVDTAGAFPGKGAEERGQAEAIASSLKLFSSIKVPVITFVLSEGGSGGALALSVADRLYMLENAIYSILSPEGFASILWKDESRAQEAAELMECTAYDLYAKGIIDKIIMEPTEGFENNKSFVITAMKNEIRNDLSALRKLKTSTLLDQRYKKFRDIGVKI
ncbi:MAG: acetyl-CoA carboxylase carboxyltransferase subunit alpha [Erysipelotrichaceae bacterium]|nr:acetyl-CoA carboxylase carboxyltransferase subunit alpha [Erysipelotrichaceae bacterium]